MKTETFFSRNIKQLIFIIFGALVFSPGLAQDKGDITAEDEMMKTAKETVEAYEAGNWEVLRNHVAPNAVFYNLGSYDSLTLDQTINYWTKGRETATPVLTKDGVWLANKINDGPRAGDWILHWGNNTLSYPGGETVSFPYHVAMKFRDDKVEEVHFYYDNNRIIRAMGYEIQPPLEDLKDEFEVEGIDDKN